MSGSIDRIPDTSYRETVEGILSEDWENLGEFYDRLTEEDTSGPGRNSYNIETPYDEEVMATWKGSKVELMGSKNLVGHSRKILEPRSESSIDQELTRYWITHLPGVRHLKGLFD